LKAAFLGESQLAAVLATGSWKAVRSLAGQRKQRFGAVEGDSAAGSRGTQAFAFVGFGSKS